MTSSSTRKQKLVTLVLAAMFLAIGIVLPFFTGQIPQIGSMLLPMHIPVLLCGLICGWRYGALVGFVLPLVRSLWLGMPPFFTAIAMAFELVAYGGIVGALYARSRWKCIVALYRCLLIAMVGGRLVWGAVRLMLTGVTGDAFTWQLFLSGALFTAIPGILLQLAVIPAIMVALDRTGLVTFSRRHSKAPAVASVHTDLKGD